MTQVFYDAAMEYFGLQEYPGARHNPDIVRFAAVTGNSWVQDDETPWCASFVGAVLAQCGVQGTGRLNARSYLEWGNAVPLENARKGHIVVFWRGSPDAATGHVAFFDRREGDQVFVLGGNQGNSVNVSPYPADRVLSVRRMAAPRATPIQSTTMRASALQVASAAGAGVSAVSTLEGPSQIAAIAFTGIIILAALWIMRERLKKWAAGVK